MITIEFYDGESITTSFEEVVFGERAIVVFRDVNVMTFARSNIASLSFSEEDDDA